MYRNLKHITIWKCIDRTLCIFFAHPLHIDTLALYLYCDSLHIVYDILYLHCLLVNHGKTYIMIIVSTIINNMHSFNNTHLVIDKTLEIELLTLIISILNQAHAWLLKIVSVCTSVRMCVCVFMCLRPRLLSSGVMWCDMYPIRLVKQVLQLLYGHCSRYH